MKFDKQTSTSWLSLGKDSHGMGAIGILNHRNFDLDTDKTCGNENR